MVGNCTPPILQYIFSTLRTNSSLCCLQAMSRWSKWWIEVDICKRFSVNKILSPKGDLPTQSWQGRDCDGLLCLFVFFLRFPLILFNFPAIFILISSLLSVNLNFSFTPSSVRSRNWSPSWSCAACRSPAPKTTSLRGWGPTRNWMEAVTLPPLQQQGVPQGQGLKEQENPPKLLQPTTTIHHNNSSSFSFSAVRHLLWLVSQVIESIITPHRFMYSSVER